MAVYNTSPTVYGQIPQQNPRLQQQQHLFHHQQVPSGLNAPSYMTSTPSPAMSLSAGHMGVSSSTSASPASTASANPSAAAFLNPAGPLQPSIQTPASSSSSSSSAPAQPAGISPSLPILSWEDCERNLTDVNILPIIGTDLAFPMVQDQQPQSHHHSHQPYSTIQNVPTSSSATSTSVSNADSLTTVTSLGLQNASAQPHLPQQAGVQHNAPITAANILDSSSSSSSSSSPPSFYTQGSSPSGFSPTPVTAAGSSNNDQWMMSQHIATSAAPAAIAPPQAVGPPNPVSFYFSQQQKPQQHYIQQQRQQHSMYAGNSADANYAQGGSPTFHNQTAQSTPPLLNSSSDEDLALPPSKNSKPKAPAPKKTAKGSTASSTSATATVSQEEDEEIITKRKAQNRAAQRAFRERKEARVRELMEKLSESENEKKRLFNENERLKKENTVITTENQVLLATTTGRYHGEEDEEEEEAKEGYNEEDENMGEEGDEGKGRVASGPKKDSKSGSATKKKPRAVLRYGVQKQPPLKAVFPVHRFNFELLREHDEALNIKTYGIADLHSENDSMLAPSYVVYEEAAAGETMLGAGAVWEIITQQPDSEDIDISHVMGFLRGKERCDGFGPVFKRSDVLRGITSARNRIRGQTSVNEFGPVGPASGGFGMSASGGLAPESMELD